jgi:hypothetical protein
VDRKDILTKKSPKSIPNSQKQKQLPNTQWLNEECLLPSPSYSRGRACKAQSLHRHFMKNQKRLQYCGSWRTNVPEAREKKQKQSVILILNIKYYISEQ